MSIRLNKAIRELNIGLQTAVEFLEKRQELGEVKGDPNFKLSDDQFKALEKEFKPDQVVKNDAAKIFQKKQKDKVRTKKTSEHKTEKLAKQETPKIKMLGKIDLEQLSKPTTKVSVASKEKKSRKNEAEINKQVEKEKKTEITSSKEKEAVEVKSAVKEKVEELPNQTITKEKSKKVEEFQKTDISTSETLKKEPMVEKEKEEKRNKKK